ncbi:hypothetical protein IQ265_13055 [Nodosilinea sp. LEGE 06152]|uniref:hypothetical protein n=1 Tax=Nodosilinea sp. LEGE 06152 TaxID=2777966 RepID=UPI001881A8C9|nr:hypothetical protein [Nodosilinea sp. LEGE 06152]MBE9157744.1 hypothetical protein [Nodosilinea sp. LEGE 06152]
MNSPDETLSETFQLKVNVRPSEAVTVTIPIDTLADLRAIADKKDVSLEGLIKFYIGQGLRADLTQLRADQTLNAAQQVLSEHLKSGEAAAKIVNEIRQRSITGTAG